MRSIGVVGGASSGCTQNGNLERDGWTRLGSGVLLAWSGKTGLSGLISRVWRASRGILATGNDRTRPRLRRAACLIGKDGNVGIDFPSLAHAAKSRQLLTQCLSTAVAGIDIRRLTH